MPWICHTWSLCHRAPGCGSKGAVYGETPQKSVNCWVRETRSIKIEKKTGLQKIRMQNNLNYLGDSRFLVRNSKNINIL